MSLSWTTERQIYSAMMGLAPEWSEGGYHNSCHDYRGTARKWYSQTWMSSCKPGVWGCPMSYLNHPRTIKNIQGLWFAVPQKVLNSESTWMEKAVGSNYQSGDLCDHCGLLFHPSNAAQVAPLPVLRWRRSRGHSLTMLRCSLPFKTRVLP